MKKCKKCGIEKPLTRFRVSFGGTYTVCKACIKTTFSTVSDRTKFSKEKRRTDKKLSASQINYLSNFFEGK